MKTVQTIPLASYIYKCFMLYIVLVLVLTILIKDGYHWGYIAAMIFCTVIQIAIDILEYVYHKELKQLKEENGYD